MSMRRSIQMTAGALVITTGLVSAGHRVGARPALPDLSGVWELDGFVGGAPVGFPNFRSVCAPESAGGVETSSPSTSAAPAQPVEWAGLGIAAEQITPVGTFTAELTITQTPATISIDRRYGGSLGTGSYKGVYQLDGSESVNTIGSLTSRTRSTWNGSQFVIDGRLTTETGTGGSVCTVRETFESDADRTLQVVATGAVAGRSKTSRQTYFAKKTLRDVR